MAYTNGRIPLTALTGLSWDGARHLRLRQDAAESLERLAWKFELAHSGRQLGVTDAYRDYDAQVRVKAAKGKYAATPGKSNHGWGIAVDLGSGINVDTSAEHRWMEANGPEHGWRNPPWATDRDPSNGQYEPWHWEYDPAYDRRKGDRGDALPLRRGSTGRNVIHVQRALGIPVDGLFGPGVDKAVREYQAARNLTPDGIVGPITFATLSTPAPTPEALMALADTLTIYRVPQPVDGRAEYTLVGPNGSVPIGETGEGIGGQELLSTLQRRGVKVEDLPAGAAGVRELDVLVWAVEATSR